MVTVWTVVTWVFRGFFVALVPLTFALMWDFFRHPAPDVTRLADPTPLTYEEDDLP